MIKVPLGTCDSLLACWIRDGRTDEATHVHAGSEAIAMPLSRWMVGVISRSSGSAK